MPTSVPTARLNVAGGERDRDRDRDQRRQRRVREQRAPHARRQERVRHPQREQHEQDGEDVERADVAERQRRADAAARCAAGAAPIARSVMAWVSVGRGQAEAFDDEALLGQIARRETSALDGPVAHDEHAIAGRGQLGGVRRRHQHGRATRRRVTDERVHGGLGADVDAFSTGSSSNSTRGSLRSHFASTTFCWLPPLNSSSGRSGSAGRSATRSSHAADLAPLGARVEPAQAPAQAAQVRAASRSRGRASSSRRRRRGGRRARSRRPRGSRRAGRRRRARRRRPRPRRRVARQRAEEQRARRARGPEPRMPGHADHLAGARRRGRASRTRPPRRPRTRSASSAGVRGARAARPARAPRPTIRRTSSAWSSPATGVSATSAAVAQHDHAVGEVQHLVEAVRDEDHGRRRTAAARRTAVNSRPTSSLCSAAVGSSRISSALRVLPAVQGARDRDDRALRRASAGPPAP